MYLVRSAPILSGSARCEFGATQQHVRHQLVALGTQSLRSSLITHSAISSVGCRRVGWESKTSPPSSRRRRWFCASGRSLGRRFAPPSRRSLPTTRAPLSPPTRLLSTTMVRPSLQPGQLWPGQLTPARGCAGALPAPRALVLERGVDLDRVDGQLARPARCDALRHAQPRRGRRAQAPAPEPARGRTSPPFALRAHDWDADAAGG